MGDGVLLTPYVLIDIYFHESLNLVDLRSPTSLSCPKWVISSRYQWHKPETDRLLEPLAAISRGDVDFRPVLILGVVRISLGAHRASHDTI